ncbi:MAG: hypothetical protein K6G28_04330 [Acholeplasmatales bacterium]|nr:hypothetical protein [Acholeplasmatales bacterium]
MMKLIKTNYRIIANIFMLVLTLISIITCVFAWFAVNKDSKGTGINVDTNNSNVYFYDEIKITRYFGSVVIETTYKKDNDNYYYEYSNGSFVTVDNEKSPLNLTAIYPNETIEVSLWYRVDNDLLGKDYYIILTNLDDSNGLFEERVNNNTYTHSALGVFRATSSAYSNIEQASWNWLLDYNGDTLADTKKERVNVKSGNFDGVNTVKLAGSNYDYYNAKFCIQCNLSQYQTSLTNVPTNALSELSVRIGSIRIIA